jgi:conjugal transfer pilus assembly protein TraW
MGIDELLFPNRCARDRRRRPRYLAFVGALLVVGSIATGNRAEDLGTLGQTYAIEEPHLLRYIEQTLRDKEKTGELASLEEQAKGRVIESIRNPKPLGGIRPTQTARTFYFDPSIKVEQNITDDKGNIIVPAGTIKNPLEVVSLSKHLLFFDGTDREQVRYARTLIDHYNGKVKPILVAGSYLDLMKAWQRSVYFDQQGVLTTKFGITQVPALVSQEGLRLRIDELSYRR